MAELILIEGIFEIYIIAQARNVRKRPVSHDGVNVQVEIGLLVRSVL